MRGAQYESNGYDMTDATLSLSSLRYFRRDGFVQKWADRENRQEASSPSQENIDMSGCGVAQVEHELVLSGVGGERLRAGREAVA